MVYKIGIVLTCPAIPTVVILCRETKIRHMEIRTTSFLFEPVLKNSFIASIKAITVEAASIIEDTQPQFNNDSKNALWASPGFLASSMSLKTFSRKYLAPLAYPYPWNISPLLC